MPFTVQANSDQPIVDVHIHGSHDFAEALELIEAAAAALKKTGAAGVVVDVRDSPYLPTYADIQAIAGRVSALFGGAPYAVVLPRGVHCGVGHQLESHASMFGGNARRFVDPAEARDWVLHAKSAPSHSASAT